VKWNQDGETVSRLEVNVKNEPLPAKHAGVATKRLHVDGNSEPVEAS